jgi:tetratricopeptide (TPR) repeat protein
MIQGAIIMHHRGLAGSGLIPAAVLFAILFACPVARAGAGAQVPDRSEIIKKLTGYQFAALDSELSGYQKAYEADPAQEMNAMIGFGAFDTPNVLIASRLDDWVKASPDSYSAAVAHATCLMATGVRWRGDGYANAVTQQQWDNMHRLFAQAVAEAKRALSIDPNLSVAYAILIKAARVGGTSADAGLAGGEALHRIPDSFAIREEMMRALLPQWGGSRSAMLNFASTSQSYARQNPSIRFLNARPIIAQCESFSDARQLKQSAACYTRAIDAASEYWLPYYRRADNYYGLGEYSLSLQDVMRADALYPGRSVDLKLLAYDTAKLNEPDASILWISQYMLVDTPDPDMFALFRSQQPALKSLGYSQ